MMHKKVMKFRDGGKAEYPIRIDLDKAKRDTAARDKARPAPPVTQRDLDRHSRIQKEEAGESGVMKNTKRYAAGGVVKQMPTSDAMGSMGMAKGGSAKGKATAKNKAMAKGKAMMAVAMLKDRMGRAMAARGAEAPMPSAPSAPMAPAAPMGGAPGMKKGGKAKAKPFAATKFGAAMMKKSADTKGRAMKKMAKGGSIDGVAIKGKTKGKMMAMGGMAGYKHGGKTH